MSTRIQQLDLLSNPEFHKQVAGALLAAAINVLNESETTPNHVNRLNWAKQIMQQPQGQAGVIMPYLLTNPTVSGAAGGTITASGTPFSDSDIDYVVASLYDQFASA